MKSIAVIGSGFSSLAAASVLAAKGFRVTVYEKNKTLGGRARSFNANGFTFDMGPSWYWMPDVFDSYFDSFGKKVSDYYELKLLDPSYCVFFGNNNLLNVPASLDALYELFDSIENNSGVRLKEFLREAAYKYEVGMLKLAYKPGLSLVEFLDPNALKGFKLFSEIFLLSSVY